MPNREFLSQLNEWLRHSLSSKSSAKQFSDELGLFWDLASEKLGVKTSCMAEGCVRLEGTIVDIFESELEVVGKGDHWCLEFPQVRSADSDPGNNLKDVQNFLLLVRGDSGIASGIWNQLSSKGELKNFLPGIPVLVKAFCASDSINSGQKIEVFGICSIRPQGNSNPLDSFGFKAYYEGGRLPHVFALKVKQNFGLSKILDVKRSNAALLSLRERLLSEFNDETVADLFLSCLISSSKRKQFDQSLDYLNINFNNCSLQMANRMKALMMSANLRPVLIDLNKLVLEQPIFASKANPFGIFRFGMIHPAMNCPLVLSEFDLPSEALGPTGKSNSNRIGSLVEDQKFWVDFPENSRASFCLGVPMISFSDHASGFSFGLKVRMDPAKFNNSPDIPCFSTEEASALESEIEDARDRLSRIDLSEDLANFAQRDFSETRASEEWGELFTVDRFLQVIKLSKHLAVLRGSDSVEEPEYLRAKEHVLDIISRDQINESRTNRLIC